MQENFTEEAVISVENADLMESEAATEKSHEGATALQAGETAGEEDLSAAGQDTTEYEAENQSLPENSEDDNPQDEPFGDYLKAVSALYGPGALPGYPQAPGAFGEMPGYGMGYDIPADISLRQAAHRAFGEYPAETGAHSGIDGLRHNAVISAMDRDLQRIKAVNPHVQSLEELPAVYRALRFNDYAPMDAAAAYTRAMAVAGARPASTGSMGTREAPAREYFTGDELDRLGPEDLKDPAVYQKAMKSLLRL